MKNSLVNWHAKLMACAVLRTAASVIYIRSDYGVL
jgi:hypothetical protein